MSTERIRALRIRQRGLITALYGHENDSFIGRDLHIYTMEQMLYAYLKAEGYQTIVFYSSTDGFYAYEKKHLACFLEGKHQEASTSGSATPLFDTGKSKRPCAGRRLVQTPENKQAFSQGKDDMVYCPDLSRGYYVRKGRMAYEAVVSKILSALDRMKQLVVIMHVTMSETELAEPLVRQLEDRLRRMAIDQALRSGENKLLVDYHLVGDKGAFGQAFNTIYRSIFTTPFFRNLFLKMENGQQLPSEQVFYVDCPKADEIIAYIHRLRLLNQKKVGWGALREICKQLVERNYRMSQLEPILEACPEISFEVLKKERLVFTPQIEVNGELLLQKLSEVKGQSDMASLIQSDILQWAQQAKRIRPLSFFCVGTSGVGKTFTTECVHQALQETGYDYVRFNMTEFMQEHEGAKLIGSPPGYVGSTTRPKLFEALRKNRRLIVCFDEIEKAHDTVITMLMNLLDAGSLSWNNEEGDFTDCILFFTSNLMQEEVVRTKRELMEEFNLSASELVKSNQFQNRIRDIFKNPVNEKSLRPEFCGRVDRYLVYNTLSAKDIIEIALTTVRKDSRSDAYRNRPVKPACLFQWAKDYAGSMYGARGLKKDVQVQLSQSDQLFLPDERVDADQYSTESALVLYEDYQNRPKIQVDIERLRERLSLVKGQMEIIEVIVSDIKAWSYIPIHQQPLNFFSVGTSGVGKTFTAELLAEALKPQGYRSVVFSMNEFSRESDIGKLIGSAPGYAGAQQRPELFKRIASCSRLVICFDEIEKAHPQIMRTLMQLLDKGKLSWNGETGDFRDCIILFTSNLEQQKMVEAKNVVLKKYASSTAALRSSELKQRIAEICCASKSFQVPVEVWGRISRFLVYNPIQAKDVMEVALQETTSLVKKIYRKQLVNVCADFLATMAERYSNHPLGMRPLKDDIRSVVTDSVEECMCSTTLTCQLIKQNERYVMVPANTQSVCQDQLIAQAMEIYEKNRFKVQEFDKTALRKKLLQVYSQEDKADLLASKVSIWFTRPVKRAPLTLFLAGTSGTGKTYTSQIIAAFLASYGYEFTDINMSEYGNEGDVWKLIGSATGYVGSDKQPLLKQAYDRSPKQVILFDEIEKAHSKILDTIMRLMERGLITLNDTECDFSQSILIFTSNVVMDQLVHQKRLLEQQGIYVDNPAYQQTMKRLMAGAGFRPDILGRINTVAVYNPLSFDSLCKVVISETRKLGTQYALHINRIDTAFVKHVASLFTESNEGARPVANYCETALGELFALSTLRSGLLDIVTNNDQLSLIPSIDQKSLSIQELYNLLM